MNKLYLILDFVINLVFRWTCFSCLQSF